MFSALKLRPAVSQTADTGKDLPRRQMAVVSVKQLFVTK